MSSGSGDNPDKTVFRQPVNRGDGTVVRPVPGGRAPAGTQSPEFQAPPQQPDYRQQPNPQSRSPQLNPSALNLNQFKTSRGLNPLVNSAAILLAVFSKTRDSLNHPNVGALHKQLSDEIKTFDKSARD